MNKRWLAILMVIVMVCSLLPVQALADAVELDPPAEEVVETDQPGGGKFCQNC